MSKPVQFSTPYSKYQPAMQRFEERSLKVAAYSTISVSATVLAGFVGSVVAVATKGRIMPSAGMFKAWERTFQVSAVGMIGGGVANSVANAAMNSKKSPFVSPRKL